MDVLKLIKWSLIVMNINIRLSTVNSSSKVILPRYLCIKNGFCTTTQTWIADFAKISHSSARWVPGEGLLITDENE